MTDELFIRYRNVWNSFLASCSDEELRHIKSTGLADYQGQIFADDLDRMIIYKQKGSKSMNEEFNKIMGGYYRK